MAECGLLKNSKAAPKEADIMENSSLLLFIITSNSRGLETMAIVSVMCKKLIFFLKKSKSCTFTSFQR